MARVSVDGGATFCSPEEAMGKPNFVGWRFFVEAMDEKVKDEVHRVGVEDGPDWELNFLKKYLELAENDLIVKEEF